MSVKPSPARLFIATLLAASVILTLIPAAPARADDLPEEAQVVGVIGHAQRYVLSCEARSGSDWAAYWGVDATEDALLAAMPRSDNPEVGFVGNPNGAWGGIPPRAYGVHPPPLANALQTFGLQAEAHQDYSWDELRGEIAAGKPVIVWIIGQMWAGTPIQYTASDGQTVIVAYYEHTMIVVGYTANSVHVVDAYSGADQYYTINTFLTSWAVLGRRAITNASPTPTLPTPQPGQLTGYTVQRGDTLSELANQFGVDWQDLAKRNAITYPYLVYTGQVLQVPGAAQPTSTCDGSTCATEEPAPAPTPTPTQAETQSMAPTPQPAVENGVYTVSAGDTLSDVAARFQLAWQDLVQANELAFPYFIYAGQRLKLPENTPISTLTAISQPAPTQTILTTATEPAPAAKPTPTASDTAVYTVQAGDYLVDLARRMGLDWQELARINGISWPYRIYPGQVLRLR